MEREEALHLHAECTVKVEAEASAQYKSCTPRGHILATSKWGEDRDRIPPPTQTNKAEQNAANYPYPMLLPNTPQCERSYN